MQAGEQPSEGDWLVADRQTAGRGRRGREWLDSTGNFMGSTIVRLQAGDPPAPSLALLAGLALYETCVPFLTDPKSLSLKWPNDLLVGGVKAAGILLERHGDAVVVGIGVNLVKAPAAQGRDTVALAQVGHPPPRNDFADRLAAQFVAHIGRWRIYGLEPVLHSWQLAAHRRGSVLTVHEADNVAVTGTFDGLLNDGSLSLRLADGTIRAIRSGDVSLG